VRDKIGGEIICEPAGRPVDQRFDAYKKVELHEGRSVTKEGVSS
jgi:hypothetical protein